MPLTLALYWVFPSEIEPIVEISPLRILDEIKLERQIIWQRRDGKQNKQDYFTYPSRWNVKFRSTDHLKMPMSVVSLTVEKDFSKFRALFGWIFRTEHILELRWGISSRDGRYW